MVGTFKDAQGRIKRQAARFQVFVYDEDNPDGRPLKFGDQVEGGGNRGTLVDIQWRVYLANKKACWFSSTPCPANTAMTPAIRAATPALPARLAIGSSSIRARAS